MRRLAVLAVLMTATLSACATGGQTSATPSVDKPSTSTPSASPSGPTGQPSASDSSVTPGQRHPSAPQTSDPRVQAAIADLAQREKAEISAITIKSVEAGHWPNGAIGCPEPDRMYTQALVPGDRVILVLQGKEYSYHAAKDQPFGYCATPSTFLPEANR